MTRGNQRDTDRARAQARQAKHAKGTTQGNPLAKREADAKALQEKIARKAAMKAEGGGDDNVNVNATHSKGMKNKKK
ncbi:unnamed protein product [Peronospora destructor]|uniref:Small EDRK-rich factor-like N-terminal domain-containing protein n=1 Tax=Peronospora destructor TaxID=86335 RepID=A0AAV0TUZ4_9STRA|nr:unnamed protein product [Peronospora destructor]